MAEKLVLASASPRRVALLEQIGIYPQVMPVDVTEVVISEDPEKTVLDNALIKLNAARKLKPDCTIIAADTVVAFKQQILGKPKSEPEAFSMLKFLSGKTHSVFTGMAVCHNNNVQTLVTESKVKFYVLSSNEIWQYIATKEPMDKAGAYGIQGRGSLFVEEIQGDYNNIVGLPVAALRKLLPIENFIHWQEK